MTVIPIWAKALIVGGILAACFAGGWEVRSWKDGNDQRVAAQTALAKQQALDAQAAVDISDQVKEKEEERAKYLAQTTDLQRQNVALEEKIRHDNLDTVTPRPNEVASAAQPFNRVFVRDWDAPLDLLYAAVGDPTRGPDLSGADTTATTVTRADVLLNHDAEVTALRDCLVKQQKHIEADARLSTWIQEKAHVLQSQ